MNDTQRESVALIGTMLGNYRLDSEIGSGGMGTVYRATHEVLGRSAAVKLEKVPRDPEGRDERLERVFYEPLS